MSLLPFKTRDCTVSCSTIETLESELSQLHLVYVADPGDALLFDGSLPSCGYCTSVRFWASNPPETSQIHRNRA